MTAPTHYGRHSALVKASAQGAPALPTRAERDAMREQMGHPRPGYAPCVDSMLLRRLLDWADAQEALSEKLQAIKADRIARDGKPVLDEDLVRRDVAASMALVDMVRNEGLAHDLDKTAAVLNAAAPKVSTSSPSAQTNC